MPSHPIVESSEANAFDLIKVKGTSMSRRRRRDSGIEKAPAEVFVSVDEHAEVVMLLYLRPEYLR